MHCACLYIIRKIELTLTIVSVNFASERCNKSNEWNAAHENDIKTERLTPFKKAAIGGGNLGVDRTTSRFRSKKKLQKQKRIYAKSTTAKVS